MCHFTVFSSGNKHSYLCNFAKHHVKTFSLENPQGLKYWPMKKYCTVALHNFFSVAFLFLQKVDNFLLGLPLVESAVLFDCFI